ncbi:hypothetical protein PG994_004069 [Apiospora phragmitis]|uniref:Uncharacterized protein n=1 Tax=Apiospora phragmitis TaxID=2905665 RepID=A0ABR1VPK0_9PEZI
METSINTPATYASMVSNKRGGSQQQQQPVHTGTSSLLPSLPHGTGSNKNNTSSSRQHQHTQQQRRGRGGGGGHAAYYQRPSPPRQQQQQQRQGQDDTKKVGPRACHVGAAGALVPPRWLKVDAHMTLFHALPGRFLVEMKQDLGETAAKTGKFAVDVGSEGVFRMGRKGVAVKARLGSGGGEGAVGQMRRGLIDRWEAMGDEGEGEEAGAAGAGAGADDGKEHMSTAEKTHGVLSAQDARRDWKAHYTIMNKEEDSARVEECFDELRGSLEQTRGRSWD